MRQRALLSMLESLNPEAIVFEPREWFDTAIVGLLDKPDDRWRSMRKSGHWVVVYSFDLAVEALLKSGDQDDIDSVAEHVYTNSMGGWYGPNTPTWVEDIESGLERMLVQ